jgi:HNH endonuclease
MRTLEQERAYVAAHRDVISARRRIRYAKERSDTEWVEKHRIEKRLRYWSDHENHLDRAKQYLANRKDEINARRRERYQVRKKEICDKRKEQYKEDSSRILAYCRKNADKRSVSFRRWADANKDKVTAKRHRRVALEKSVGGSWTEAEWKALKAKYGNRCLCCGLSEEELVKLHRVLSPDHVIPMSRGGRNDIGNLQPLCHSKKLGSRGGCNNIKHTKIIDYRKQVMPCGQGLPTGYPLSVRTNNFLDSSATSVLQH